jgi:hypothetical protein
VATHTFVDLHIPEAAVLADLTGIEADLRRAREYAQVLDSQMRSAKPDWDLVEGLSAAVAVVYSRAFGPGVRANLREDDLACLSPGQRDAHDRLRAYRDKHVAHSINAFEHNQPRAHYCLERVESEGITGIGCSHGRVSSLSSRDVANVIELTAVLLQYVGARIKEEQTKLLGVVRAMPLTEILAGGQGAFRVDSDTPVDRPRRK